jgi:thiamine pyrophosphokinase
MTAAIICNGHIADYEFHARLVEGCSLVICADGGACHAKRMGINPHVILGDFDSCSREFAEGFLGVKIVEYPSEKDETDTELAIQYALSSGEKHIMLLGATGTRLDHTIANLGLLMVIAQRGGTGEIINEQNRAFLITDNAVVKGKGTQVSLIAYCGDVKGVTLKGFKYPLNDFTLEMGSTRGISNVLEEETGEISIKEGILLAVLARD